ncbi:MAG: right-handed parallel beta-helix repeat-containing protein, partial [Thermoplasmata archaeon]|nr:right-handed parallel beta-helix repeat-containing protein [Thermoplasmata archaeon]
VIWLCVLMVSGGFSVTLNFEKVAKGKDVGAPRPTAVDVTFDIPVQLGWNFISVPLVQWDTDILEVLDDHGGDTQWNCAQWYNATDIVDPWKTNATYLPAFLNTLFDVNHTMGIFLNITNVGSDGHLRVNGTSPPTTTIPLYAGNNYVGYPTVDDTSYTVGDVKAATGDRVTQIENRTNVVYPDDYVLKRGEGYQFVVSENCTWTITNTLVAHNPIRIDSDADFDEDHGVVNWATGDGSQGNPWIIENYSISGTGYGYCIYIGNTTDYFVVRNNYLHEADGFFFWPHYALSGMVLSNVENGMVANNRVLSNGYYGICLDQSTNNTLTENNASLNNYHGILLDHSDDNTIANNTVDSNDGSGILLRAASSNTIANNTVDSNAQWGGIYLREASNDNTIVSNTITNNEYDFYTDDGSTPGTFPNTNLIYHNNFINNAKKADDDGTNYWDNGYPDGGNYWSEYIGVDLYSGSNQDILGSDNIGDTSYGIDGAGSNVDHYPLMTSYDGEGIGATDDAPPQLYCRRDNSVLA